MTNHPLKPRPTSAELMERKRKRQEQRATEKAERQEVKQMLKYAWLQFDYERIPEEHREAVQKAAHQIRLHMRRTVVDMVRTGEYLSQVRELLLADGKYHEWLKAEFDMSVGAASEFRNIAARFSKRLSIIETLTPTVVRRLAAPSVPNEAVDAVFAAAVGSEKPIRIKDAMAIVKPFLPARVAKPKQLPGPVAEPEPDAIEAEYTVMPKEEFIFPARALDPEHCAPIISRDLARKLQDAMVNRIFRVLLSNGERDELLIALTRALEE